MSEHDDTLLDGDLGDEEYDLGNDEEEALLADDYELERQNSYKGEEETDDVLDLGVTDALDDLDAEDENIEFGRSKTDNSNENDFYEDGERQKPGNRYDQDSGNNVGDYKGGDQAGSGHTRSYEERGTTSGGDSVNVSSGLGRVDLREKLQRNVQKVYVGNGQGLEDDDCEEAKERRNRFQNERTIVSPKMNTNIPDSLENVVTPEPSRLSFRGRGRGRILRGGGGGGVRGGGGVGGGLIAGGGRFNTQASGNFNPRFGGVRNPSFENQQPSCRPPLLETRPPFLLGLPNNVQNQQIIYQQSNPPLQPFQHYTPNNGPIPSHFVDNRQQTFQGPGPFHGQPGPRIIGPRLEYGPRTGGGGGDGRGSGSGGGAGGTGGLTGSIQGPPYGCSPGQPPYGQLQPGHFQNSLPDNHPPRLVQTNQPPLLQGNPPGASLLGNPGPLVTGGGPPAPLLPGNQGLPMQAFPRGGPPSFSQGPPGNHPNVQMPGNQQQQPPFEGRPTFQESQFEGRPVYDSRPSGYSDQPPAGQFNNGPQSLPPAPQQQQQQQPAPNVPNVPLAPGHKILINPHFRGAVQPTNDARLVWDSAQQQISSQSQQVSAGGQFPPSSVSYQSQTSYGGQSQQQRAGPHYQQSYQQNKSDDPYTYFSDVWQENKPQKMPTACSPGKQYTQSENSYSRDANYSVDKYKSDSQWEPKDYPEVAVGERSSRFHYQATRGGLRPERSDFQDRVACHPSYREREASMKSSSSSRSDHLPKGRPPLPSGGSSYRDDVYEQKPGVVARPPTGPGPRGVQQRLPPKRASDPTDRPLRDLSPKRMKPTNRNLQEVRTVDNLNDPSVFEKKEEDSDPEMQEYRKKMEEQKRLREKILREKENRRKLAAMEKQNEEAKSSETSGDGGQQQETRQPSSSSGLLGVVKESIRGQATIGRGRARPTNAHTTEGTERPGGVRIVRTIQAIPASDTTTETSVTKGGNPGGNSQLLLAENNNNNNNRTLAGQSGGVRRVVIQKPLNTQKVVATTIQKTVSNLQKGPTVGCSQTKVIASGGQPQTATLKKILPSSAQRIVTQKPSVGLQKTVINVQEPINAGTTQQKVVLVAGSGGGGGGSQNNQRVVLQKGQQKKLPEIIKTNTVKLENLAASTSEAQIRRMCQGIGTIESVHMGERSATVVFKTQSAAMVFHKKYQRKMLDLSLITVRLVPQSATGTKSSANVLKVS